MHMGHVGHMGLCIGWIGKPLARSTQAELALSGQVICNVKWLRLVNVTVDCLSTRFLLPALAKFCFRQLLPAS